MNRPMNRPLNRHGSKLSQSGNPATGRQAPRRVSLNGMTTDPTATLDVLALPTTPLAQQTIELVTDAESPALANHSIRSFLFARLLADHRGAVAGADYDPQLLFLACTLHDVGLSADGGDRDERFEVAGADLAAEFLTARGVAAADVDTVWQAIALHTSIGIAERRGAICELTAAAIAIDFGLDSDFVSDADAAAIHHAYPRFSLARSLADSIIGQAQRRPEKAPFFSVAAQLLRERAAPPHITLLEEYAPLTRWGSS